MCTPRLSDTSSEMTDKKFGIRFWYFIKIVEYVLTAVSILLLILNEYLSVVRDDFTPANTKAEKTPNNDPSDKQNLSAKYSPLTMSYLEDRRLLRVKRFDDHHHPETSLSYLLILYPSCTTVLIVLTMEILAQALKEPLNKLSNIVLIFLCIALSIIIFAVTLICAIDTVHVSMILVALLSAVLTVVMVVDFVSLILL